MFTQKEIDQFTSKGINLETIEKQIYHFKTGFPFVELVGAAIKTNGICILNNEQIENLVASYDKLSKEINILKFVPASGAATRMFKHLFSFKDTYKNTTEDYHKYFSDQKFNSVYYFINHIERFAFYDDLKAAMSKDGISIIDCIDKKDYVCIIDYLLTEKGLNYSNLPKALLKFHKYDSFSRTAIEEHLVESANYCKDKDNVCAIHFTISPEHQEKFSLLVNSVVKEYENTFNVKYNITYSVQNPSTDTIAVDIDNIPVVEKDGTILFRPAGHGALIENLNNVDADLVFIKNIDNIVPDSLKAETYLYKKALAGLLMDLHYKTQYYLRLIEVRECNEELLAEIARFAVENLNIKLDIGYEYLTINHKYDYLLKKLNRPMRICGMVKNEGEPGGGPFWVRSNDRTVSLQIIESSQINLQNHEQSVIFKSSTHFNPVDLVCCLIDYRGKRFNLPNFVDPSTGFITIKSKDGKDIKAMELPGLWNGAMADWITVFVEVPLSTFNPVKTVNDLLRKEHQS
ncbi:MAG: NAD metabolism ATPase/kinase [Bacteroidetes bacterium CG2_30_32_10]|nr:MAG: NAD metabolism ATPase/kinase [Bacteroidetes bacterium CG2_30_32_10]